MKFTDELLPRILRRTDGRCHICHKRLALKNYAREGARGAWEVDHSVPRSKGGTDHLNNLFAACIQCNRDKSNLTTRTARGWNGKTRAPLSPEKRDEVRGNNTFWGAVGGAILGCRFGLPGALLGGLAGAFLGCSVNPDATG